MNEAKNYQIIIVNDGSTDDTGKICEEYQKNNSIKYIYQENKGLGAARNTGLDVLDAIGKIELPNNVRIKTCSAD